MNVTKRGEVGNITDYADSDTLGSPFYRNVTVRIQLVETGSIKKKLCYDSLC